MPATVLVAEDQTDIRDLLAMNLRQAGYEVTAVTDGEAALASQKEGGHDLLILDLMMPGWTAWRCARRCAPGAAPRPS
jgi:DNA-binding response OmpR family regulator